MFKGVCRTAAHINEFCGVLAGGIVFILGAVSAAGSVRSLCALIKHQAAATNHMASEE